jgi:hypothetical protein
MLMAAPLIEPSSDLVEHEDGQKKTNELRTADRVTTPDGDRVGMVRCLYRGGLLGKTSGVTTVKFTTTSVRHTDATNTARPSSWVMDVPDDADWTTWRFTR